MTGSCSWYGHEVVIVDVDAYVTVMDWFWFPQGSIEILKLCKANMFRLSLNRPMPNPTGNFVMASSWKILSQFGVSTKWFWSNPLIDSVSSKCDLNLNILEQCGLFKYLFSSAGFHEFRRLVPLRPQSLRRESGIMSNHLGCNHLAAAMQMWYK